MTEPLSLRERNRLETLSALHDAAAELALTRGLADTTVEEVTRRVGVSPRTFFNYYATKDDAVLGIRDAVVTEPALRAFLDDTGPLFRRVVRLLVAVVRATAIAGPTDRRLELARRHPELRERQLRRVVDAEHAVLGALRDPGAAGGDPAVRDALAGDADAPLALVMLAGSTLRFAYLRDPDAAVADLDGAVERSLSVVREVVQSTL
ncbi:TetR/AcrR family transcriptional regulator [Thalassiella azotivora]